VAWTELARAHVPAAEKVGDGLDLRDSGREQDRIDVQRPSVDELDLDQAEIRAVEHAAHADACEPGCRRPLATLHESVPGWLTESRPAEREEAGDELGTT
jgi:hypothetical protein